MQRIFVPQIKLTQLVILNIQVTGIGYSPLFLTSAIKMFKKSKIKRFPSTVLDSSFD